MIPGPGPMRVPVALAAKQRGLPAEPVRATPERDDPADYAGLFLSVHLLLPCIVNLLLRGAQHFSTAIATAQDVRRGDKDDPAACEHPARLDP